MAKIDILSFMWSNHIFRITSQINSSHKLFEKESTNIFWSQAMNSSSYRIVNLSEFRFSQTKIHIFTII